jgi:hypothetical protein
MPLDHQVLLLLALLWVKHTHLGLCGWGSATRLLLLLLLLLLPMR